MVSSGNKNQLSQIVLAVGHQELRGITLFYPRWESYLKQQWLALCSLVSREALFKILHMHSLICSSQSCRIIQPHWPDVEAETLRAKEHFRGHPAQNRQPACLPENILEHSVLHCESEKVVAIGTIVCLTQKDLLFMFWDYLPVLFPRVDFMITWVSLVLAFPVMLIY